LLPGQYKLEVKGMNADGQWSEISSYQFSISPIWYLQTWFIIFTILSILSIGYAFYRWRIRTLENKYKIEREITHLKRSALQAQMNPHFIFNCLNSIQSFIMHNEKTEAMDYLSKFALLIRQNLKASIEDVLTLEDEVSMLDNYLALEQVRFDHAFHYEIKVPIEIDTSTIQLPPLLIQPYVENAVIHGVSKKSSGGKITVSFTKKENELLVKISDNGLGISGKEISQTHKSYGTSITQKRLEFINKNYKDKHGVITQSDENGTHIMITIII
jgi:LytS/YehU family sensor histidine kinase